MKIEGKIISCGKGWGSSYQGVIEIKYEGKRYTIKIPDYFAVSGINDKTIKLEGTIKDNDVINPKDIW